MSEPKQKRLTTCNLCRRRKIKCDRQDPCSHCVHAGISCVRAPPSHLPRGRQGGRRKADSGLLDRISKLESLVKDLESSNDSSSATDLSRRQSANEDSKTPVTRAAQPKSKIPSRPQPNMDRYLAPSVWVTLSEQINGMREVLEQPSDSEDDETTPESASLSPEKSGSSSIIVFGPELSIVGGPELQHPPPAIVFRLVETFLHNVERIGRILHAPSVKSYFSGYSKTLDCSPGLKGLESLKFAIYYAAVTSLSEGECFEQLGEDRSTLLARFRAGVEVTMARSDLILTEDLSMLQALVIFMKAARSNENTRFTWTLMGLAVRLAQALGINREASLLSVPPFEREIRRRLWWSICMLDFFYAQDRGTERVIFSDGFDTRMPQNIDDADLVVGATEEPTRRTEFADVTFDLICIEVFETASRLSDSFPTNSDTKGNDWTERRDMVIACRRKIEDRYLRYCKGVDQIQRFTVMVADVITACQWLMVYRPIQRQAVNIKSADIPYPGILHLCIDLLEKSHHIMTDPIAKNFQWNSRTFVQWHPMAVILAELCVQVEGPTVERAWNIVRLTYDYTAQSVADSGKGRLWRPIRKLMNRAQAVRKAYLDQANLMRAEQKSQELPIQDLKISPPVINDVQMNQFCQPQPAPMAQGTNRMNTLDINFQGLDAQGDNSFVMNTQGMEGLQFDVPIDWDPWLIGTAGNANANANANNSAVNQMGWTNWTTFVDDFYDGSGSLEQAVNGT